MKRKLLKLLFLTVIVSILVLVIFITTKDKKVNLVILGDYLGVHDEINESYYSYLRKFIKIRRYNNYSKREEKMDSLKDRINYTSEIKRNLREAELVTISIGLNDFYSSLRQNISTTNLLDLKDNINDLLPKLDSLLENIRKYAKYDVVLIGYYNPVPFLFNTNEQELDLLFLYVDSMIKDITNKHNVTYIPLYDIFKNNKYIGEDIYPNSEGYKEISRLIVMNVNKKE